MLRQISEDMRVNLKDRLRDIRQHVRSRRRDSAPSGIGESRHPPFPIGDIEGLLGHAAAALDDALSVAETLVPRRGRRSGGGAPQGLGVYFPTGGATPEWEGERAFRRDLYYLIQSVLAKRMIDAAVVHESNLAAVHAAMRHRHADRLATLSRAATPEQRTKAAAGVCAALLLVLLNRHPIVFADGPAETHAVSGEIGCLAPVALACGLASVGVDDMPDSDLLDMAMLAADVRHDRIVQACRAPEATGELTMIFEVLLAHLR